MFSAPGARYQLQFVYFAGGFGAVCAAVCGTIGLELNLRDTAWLGGVGLLLIISGIWRIIAQRFRSSGIASSLTEGAVDVRVACLTLWVGGNICAHLSGREWSHEAATTLSLYLMAAFVGFLVLHVRSARTRSQLAAYIGRWVVLCVAFAAALWIPFIPLVILGMMDLDSFGMSVACGWALVVSLGSLVTGVLMLFNAPSDSWGPGNGVFAGLGGAVASIGLVLATTAGIRDGEIWLILAGLFGLLTMEILWCSKQDFGFRDGEIRMGRILIAVALASLTAVGTFAALAHPSTAFLAPIGVATTVALLAAGNDADRSRRHLCWSAVCAGFVIAALLPVDLLA